MVCRKPVLMSLGTVSRLILTFFSALLPMMVMMGVVFIVTVLAFVFLVCFIVMLFLVMTLFA